MFSFSFNKSLSLTNMVCYQRVFGFRSNNSIVKINCLDKNRIYLRYGVYFFSNNYFHCF